MEEREESGFDLVRLARVVAPGIPHHITQRGNRWQETCFCAEDYIEQNPVRAGLAASPGEYPLSSARAHVAGRHDALVTAAPLLKRVGNWQDFLALETSEEEARRLRRHERTGRPLGSEPFTWAVERQLRRTLRRGKPGPQGSRAS